MRSTPHADESRSRRWSATVSLIGRPFLRVCHGSALPRRVRRPSRVWWEIATQARVARNGPGVCQNRLTVQAGEQAGGNGGGLGILLVEDDDGDALLVEDELAETLPGCTVRRLRTLAQAVAEPPEGIDR